MYIVVISLTNMMRNAKNADVDGMDARDAHPKRVLYLPEKEDMNMA